MTLSTLLEIILVIYGIYTLVGITLKPDFYWNYRRMRRRRELIGDVATARMYAVIGVLMLVVGGLGLFGII